jgi:arginyl-tRNA synthetase
MINLKRSLAADIAIGLQTAIKKKEMPQLEKLPAAVVKRTEDPIFGDYASPVALQLAPLARGKPMEIVEIIARHMPKKEYIAELQVAEPGFLNIWLSDSWLAARLDDILEQDLRVDVNVGQGQLANLEFISANPTGPLTLGNVRTAFGADTLANVLTYAGYNVTREYYINDVGKQAERLGESVLRRLLQRRGIKVEYAEDLYQGEYITGIAETIGEELEETEGKKFTAADLKNKALLEQVSKRAMELCLWDIKRTVEEDLHIRFDVWTSEADLRRSGMVEKTLEAMRRRKLTYLKGKTEYLRTTKFGDDQDRVLVKRDGQYAYIAPDIGYHHGKYEREYDLIFTFLGADHQGHIPKLKAAMEALGNDLTKLHFVVAQWVSLKRGKQRVALSKRKGEIYGPQELIKEIGYDVARFFMVQHSLTAHMELDLDLAQERSERNPVYYVQYAYVRLQSILRKAKERGLVESIDEIIKPIGKPVLSEPEEFQLLRSLFALPEVVEDIAYTHEVHRLPYYAHDLAKDIHVFYKNVPVISVKDQTVLTSRLQLVQATRQVLGEVLGLLGVSKPDVM